MAVTGGVKIVLYCDGSRHNISSAAYLSFFIHYRFFDGTAESLVPKELFALFLVFVFDLEGLSGNKNKHILSCAF